MLQNFWNNLFELNLSPKDWLEAQTNLNKLKILVSSWWRFWFYDIFIFYYSLFEKLSTMTNDESFKCGTVGQGIQMWQVHVINVTNEKPIIYYSSWKSHTCETAEISEPHLLKLIDIRDHVPIAYYTTAYILLMHIPNIVWFFSIINPKHFP